MMLSMAVIGNCETNSHGNGHLALGDSVHRRRDERCLDSNLLGES